MLSCFFVHLGLILLLVDPDVDGLDVWFPRTSRHSK